MHDGTDRCGIILSPVYWQASTTTELGEEADSTEGSASWRTFIPKQFRQWQSAAASRLPSLLTTSQATQVIFGREAFSIAYHFSLVAAFFRGFTSLV